MKQDEVDNKEASAMIVSLHLEQQKMVNEVFYEESFTCQFLALLVQYDLTASQGLISY